MQFERAPPTYIPTFPPIHAPQPQTSLVPRQDLPQLSVAEDFSGPFLTLNIVLCNVHDCTFTDAKSSWGLENDENK